MAEHKIGDIVYHPGYKLYGCVVEYTEGIDMTDGKPFRDYNIEWFNGRHNGTKYNFEYVEYLKQEYEKQDAGRA